MYDGDYKNNGWGQAGSRHLEWVFNETAAGGRTAGDYGTRRAAEAIVAELNINNDSMTFHSAEVVDGWAPDNIVQYHDFNVTVRGSDNTILDSYGMRDPRVIYYEAETNLTVLEDVNFTLVFPYFNDTALLQIYNETGTKVIEVNLTQVLLNQQALLLNAGWDLISFSLIM